MRGDRRHLLRLEEKYFLAVGPSHPSNFREAALMVMSVLPWRSLVIYTTKRDGCGCALDGGNSTVAV